MTNKDEALKLAIEALDDKELASYEMVQKAWLACKEALEQQECGFNRDASHSAGEYVCTCGNAMCGKEQQDIAKLNDEYLKETYVEGISERYPQQDKDQEPVAYNFEGVLFFANEASHYMKDTALPLYTQPAKTLSDDELLECWEGYENTFLIIDHKHYGKNLTQRRLQVSRHIEAKILDKMRGE